MTVVFAIVFFLLAHVGSRGLFAATLSEPQGWQSFGNVVNRRPSPPSSVIRRAPTAPVTRSDQSRQESRVRNGQKVKERALSMLQKFSERLDRYEEFLGKVESRKQKLADKGVDVSNINALISTGTSNLAAARAALETARTAVNAIDTSGGDPQAVRTRVRTQLEAVRTAMRRLHTSMGEIVRTLRQATATGAGGGAR